MLPAALASSTVLALAPLAAQDPSREPPPARALSRELTVEPRLAGTRTALRAARWVADQLRSAGFEVALDEREVLLSYPRRIELAGYAGEERLFERIETFDPDAEEPGDVPRYNAYGKSGRIAAGVVDVGHGLRADYERLAADGVEVAGRIALARYGGSYRGVKAELAEEHGCVGCLLFSDPEGDGAPKGAVWPEGPWKPGWAAQRGSIAPLAVAPGDPTTPGWPSAAPGETGERAGDPDVDARLPGIPCLAIGADEASALIVAGAGARVSLRLDAPRELRPIVNVLGRLPGEKADFVVAGNHRDAWVRGAHDAGSGTVSLIRAAEILGERVRAGWRPANGIVLGFWDAEEFGLIGSTEWGEAHAEELQRHAIAYVNADAAVSGLELRVSGTPGLLASLRRALERVPAPLETNGSGAEERVTLWDRWSADGVPDLGLPGSGSDYTVFLHHLGLPILDLGLSGNPGGHYHTVFDDFEMMDRFLDPTWQGHETAGRALAEILAELAESGKKAFDDAEAARAMAEMVRDTGAEEWLGAERAEKLAAALDELARVLDEDSGPPVLYGGLLDERGLPDRPWYRNWLWAPGLETGYSSETLPTLRLAAREGEDALASELAERVELVRRLADQRRAEASKRGQ